MKTHYLKIFKRLFSIAIVVLFISCEMSDDSDIIDVSGTYVGNISGNFKGTETATVTVTNIDGEIEVHCFSDSFEATVRLDVYDNDNRMMVCLTGGDFEGMYGHMLSEESMNHNGINWMQHLNNEHQEGDEHFGFFDMQHNTFNYTFKTTNEDFLFEGTKTN